MGRDTLNTTQPCDWCGEPVPVHAVSPSECFCSFECANWEEDVAENQGEEKA